MAGFPVILGVLKEERDDVEMVAYLSSFYIVLIMVFFPVISSTPRIPMFWFSVSYRRAADDHDGAITQDFVLTLETGCTENILTIVSVFVFEGFHS